MGVGSRRWCPYQRRRSGCASPAPLATGTATWQSTMWRFPRYAPTPRAILPRRTRASRAKRASTTCVTCAPASTAISRPISVGGPTTPSTRRGGTTQTEWIGRDFLGPPRALGTPARPPTTRRGPVPTCTPRATIRTPLTSCIRPSCSSKEMSTWCFSTTCETTIIRTWARWGLDFKPRTGSGMGRSSARPATRALSGCKPLWRFLKARPRFGFGPPRALIGPATLPSTTSHCSLAATWAAGPRQRAGRACRAATTVR